MKTATRREVERALLEFLIDDMFCGSSSLRRMRKRILHCQRRLREVASDEAWNAYLDLEAATNARSAKQLRLLFERLLAAYGAGLAR